MHSFQNLNNNNNNDDDDDDDEDDDNNNNKQQTTKTTTTTIHDHMRHSVTSVFRLGKGNRLIFGRCLAKRIIACHIWIHSSLLSHSFLSHCGLKQPASCNRKRANERAVRANERRDERVEQYIRLDFRLFWTIMLSRCLWHRERMSRPRSQGVMFRISQGWFSR